MNDYQPLDIDGARNADALALNADAHSYRGAVSLHGLPFHFGPAAGDKAAVVGWGEGVIMDPLVIPIRAVARTVIIAHRLVDSKLHEGDPVGRVVAVYSFQYADGQCRQVPIRERFEIGAIPLFWGELAFLAYPDGKDGMMPRYTGAFDIAGNRLVEACGGWPHHYYLWPWINPRPDVELASLTVRPTGPRAYIGAITLGHLDEEPLNHTVKREVKIVLPRREDAAKDFALEVEVDRGTAAYAHPLPAESVEEFLASDFKGWGQEQNRKASPAWVEITATPSATIIVKQDGETLGAARWGDVQQRGVVEAGPRLRLELVDYGRNWVRTTVLDDETGKPIPCRIHFRSRDGVPYQPHGHHNYLNSNQGTWHLDIGGDLRLGQITYAYIDGRCEGWLPRGEVLVDIARGFEYEPIRQLVTIAPGQQELVFRLKRLRDMSRERYFSGDTHVHFLSTQGAHFEAAGEGLNVVNLLLSQWGNLFTNTEEFTGEPSTATGGQTIVYANQENRQHILGHLTLLGLKEPIYPWCSGGPDEAEFGGNLETTLSRWADACRAQGGTVIVPHIPNPNCEPAALIATGRADAAEFLVHDSFQHLEYYRYLNCGYKLPLVGGTDKMSADVPVGLYRTYVHIPADEPFGYESWLKHLKGGNTFLSGGPLLRFHVEGRPIGATIDLPGNGGDVEVEAEAVSIFPFHCLELVLNGRVIARTEEPRGARAMRLRERVRVERHSWLAARCAGPGYTSVRHYDGWRRGIMAHTSPVYLAVGEPWWMFDVATAQYLLTLMHGGIEYIRKRAAHYRPGTVTHHHGRQDHLAFLEEPFRQAIEALHHRMHALGIPH